VLDECDIASGYSRDSNADGVPDECQPCAAPAWDALVAPLGTTGESLGHAVACDGDWLFMGAPSAAVDGLPAAGRVLVARRAGAHWTIVDELIAAPSVQEGASFGAAVAVRDNLAVIGAPGADPAGAVHVYRLSASLGVWQREAVLEKSQSLSPGAALGFSVAVDGTYVVAGAPGDDLGGGSLADAGSAAVFEYDLIAAQWDAGTLLAPPNPGAVDLAGFAVDISISPSPHVVIGAPTEDGPGDTLPDVGAVYRWTKAGDSWTLDPTTYRLTDGAADDAFGVTVAVRGDEFFAGAPGHQNAATRGLVAVLGPNPARIEAPVGDVVGFGRLISLNAERLAIAAPFDPSLDSRVYLYERNGGAWRQLVHVGQELHPEWLADAPCLALAADTLFVGDGASDAACTSCGAVFVYGRLTDCNANDWIDLCEIATGAAIDCNRTGTPDACELFDDFDFDSDGDVDFDDFLALAESLVGPDNPPVPNDPPCSTAYLTTFDTEPDGDLDLHDFAAFQAAFAPNVTQLR